MADKKEILTALEVKTGDAIKSVQDLRDNIKNLKDGLKDLEMGSEEYRIVIGELTQNQNELKDAMNTSSMTLEEAVNGVDTANMSYNDLVHTMAELTKVWRDTTDETARAKIGDQILGINTKLKELDATKGTFTRNVGDYANQMAKGFAATAGAAGSVINPIKGVTTGFKALSTTPVIAILGLLANILDQVIKSLHSSEENTKAVTASMSAFSAIGDVVTKVMQGLGSVVSAVVGFFGDLIEKLGILGDKAEERKQIAEQEQALLEMQRDALYKNADAELEVAKLKQQAADKINYTHEQRIAFLEQAAKKEEEIAQRAYDAAKQEYEIIKAKNALTQSSTEELNKEAEAYAKMINAQTAYFNKTKETTSQISAARKQAASDAASAQKALLSAQKNLIDQELAFTIKGTDENLRLQKESAAKAYEIEVANAKSSIKNRKVRNETLEALAKKYHKTLEDLERQHQKTITSIQMQQLQNDADIYEAGTRVNLEALKKVRKFALDTMQKEEGESEEAFFARRLKAQKEYNDVVRSLNALSRQEATAGLRLAIAEGEQAGEAYLEGQMQLAAANLRLLQRETGESVEEFEIRKAIAQKAYNDATNEYLNYMDEQERLGYENRMNAAQEGSLEYLALAIQLKQHELDTLHRLEGESDEEFYARKLQAEKNYIEAKKELASQQITLAQNVASATSGILGSLADIYESDTDATEEELKKAKNLRIAGATIDMLSGVVAAISQAQELGPIAGPIMAAVNSAAVIAAGIANITKIKQQSTSASGGSTTTPAEVSAPSVETKVQEVRNITSASEEERLNRMASDQKVYLVTSELEAKQKGTKVKVQESSF